MRILAVVNMYPPHHLGGYEVACRGVMDRFAERGHDVLVLTGDTRLEGVDDDESQVEESRSDLPEDGASSTRPVEVRRELGGWWDWGSFGPLRATLRQRLRIERQTQRAVRRALDDFEPDVVSVWSLRFLSYSIPTLVERRGIPMVLTLCDDWICYAHQYDGWTRLFDRRPWAQPVGRVLGLATTLPSFEGATVSVASHTLDDEIAASCRWRVAPAPVVPLGVETRDFPVSKPRAPNWAWRLLYVGRVVGIKGVPTLLRAMADLPTGAQLVIDGHAPDAERDDMMDLVRELGVADRVRWRRSPRAALRARYRDADVVVFPSEWAEPFGIVPLEAMACGVPVVATGTGGSGEFLEDDVNCVLFRPGDAPALAAALHRLADDAALRTRVTAGGTATALRMTMDRYAEQLEDLHVAAARRGRGPVHSNADSNQARRARATGSGP